MTLFASRHVDLPDSRSLLTNNDFGPRVSANRQFEVLVLHEQNNTITCFIKIYRPWANWPEHELSMQSLVVGADILQQISNKM